MFYFSPPWTILPSLFPSVVPDETVLPSPSVVPDALSENPALVSDDGEIPDLVHSDDDETQVSDRRIFLYDSQGRQAGYLPNMPPMHPKRGAQPRMSVTARKEKE